MSISQFFTLMVFALIGWSVVFSILKLVGILECHAMWAMSPAFVGIVIYVIMMIIAAALGTK